MDKAKAAAAKETGNQEFAAKNYAAAIKSFTEAIQWDPTDHVFYSNRSACYASMQKYREALEDGKKCVELKPDWVRGYTRKGLAEFYLSEYDAAEATYKKGLEIDPNNEQLKAGLEEAQRKLNEPPPNPFANMFNAENLAKLRMHPKTAPYFQDPSFMQKLSMMQQNPQLLQAFLQDPAIMNCLSVILGIDLSQAGAEGEHQHGEGCSHDHGHEHSHEPPHSHHHEEEAKAPPAEPSPEEAARREAEEEKVKGNAAYKSRQFQQALDHYNRALELNPSEILYMTNKAAVYYEMGELEKCLKECDDAVEKGKEVHADLSKVAKAFNRKATAYQKMDHIDEAINALQLSLREYYDDKIKFQLKDLEKAKKRKEEEAYINPEIAESENAAGNEFFKASNFPAALEKYNEAIRRNPKSARYLANRSAVYLKLMEPMHALQDANKSLDLDKTVVKVWARKGNIHFLMKEYHKAMEAFESGLKLDENNDECQEGLQKVMAAINSSDDSVSAEERRKHAMADPEIQSLLTDPQIMNVLRDLSERPRESQHYMSDPKIRSAINKLVAAGVVKMG